MPASPKLLFLHPFVLFVYFTTFAIVTSIWYSHNRLFASYFVRTPLTVFLNFLMLAFTLLMVYMLQVFMHFGAETRDPWASIGYFGCFSVVFGLLCVLYTIGARARWKDLDTEKRRMAVRVAVRAGVVSATLAVFLVLAGLGVVSFWWVPVAIAPAMVVSRLFLSRVLPRIT